MTIECARIEAIDKPWGSHNLRPWSVVDHGNTAIGELWFERADKTALPPALLVKLLFAEQRLSIQVHPDDVFAQSIGLANGKTEAWVVLAAKPGAQVALGLKHTLSDTQLRTAIIDGTIADQVRWRKVIEGDVIFVPAGTIHAIGPGIVIAEFQQRSDATFRLFDYGSARELHIQHALSVSNAGPASRQPSPKPLTKERTLLVSSPFFILEKLELLPGSLWELSSDDETWLLVLEGHGEMDDKEVSRGEAMYIEQDRSELDVGAEGLKGLVVYRAPRPSPSLLRKRDGGLPAATSSDVRRPQMKSTILASVFSAGLLS